MFINFNMTKLAYLLMISFTEIGFSYGHLVSDNEINNCCKKAHNLALEKDLADISRYIGSQNSESKDKEVKDQKVEGMFSYFHNGVRLSCDLASYRLSQLFEKLGISGYRIRCAGGIERRNDFVDLYYEFPLLSDQNLNSIELNENSFDKFREVNLCDFEYLMIENVTEHLSSRKKQHERNYGCFLSGRGMYKYNVSFQDPVKEK